MCSRRGCSKGGQSCPHLLRGRSELGVVHDAEHKQELKNLSGHRIGKVKSSYGGLSTGKVAAAPQVFNKEQNAEKTDF